jgi:hypothetical protein
MTSSSDAGFEPTEIRPAAPPGESPDGWQQTRAQTTLATRFVGNKDEYLANQPTDIGRAVGDNLRELFVSCDPAPALLQQFDHAQPEFIAVHDVGTGSARKLLTAVAEATGLGIKKLAIRRQGYGTTLATLEFIEFPSPSGGGLRLYCTEADADTASRQGLARVLLAYSRLGVLMVGELPGHALATAFKPLRDDIIAGPWPNRDLLLVPVATNAALAAQGSDLGRGTGITVRTTPAAVRPSDAWNFISGAWARLRSQIGTTGKVIPALGPTAAVPAAPAIPAPTTTAAATNFGPAARTPALQPLSLRPMPAVPQSVASQTLDAATAEVLQRYVQQLHKLGGVLEACVFDMASGRSVAHAGSAPDADALGSIGSGLLASITRAALRLQLTAELPEAAITLEARHLILRPLPRPAGLMLHAVLDKEHANLTLARLQIQRLDELLLDAGG